MSAIQVFLISDYQLVVWGVERLFESVPHRFQYMSSLSKLDGRTNELIIVASPDVLILDIDTNPDQAISMISALRAGIPHCKILLLTRLDDKSILDHAVMHGARGIVDKNTSPDILLTAISKVHEGQLWLDHEATTRIFVEFSRARSALDSNATRQVGALTAREQQIVTFFTQNSDASGKVLARLLSISESTLRNHLTSIYAKLGVRNYHGLLAYVLQHNFEKQPKNRLQ